MSNPIPPRRGTWAAALANAQPGILPSAHAVRILRHRLALDPALEGVDLSQGWVREAIDARINDTLRFSPDGASFVALGPGGRIWGGDEDEILRKLGNSIGAVVAAAAQAERPVELTSVEDVAAQRKKSGIYAFGVALCLLAPMLGTLA
jgi:hypothetical protein